MSTRGHTDTDLIVGERREEAERRNAAWSALDPKTQLDRLDNRLGKGVGAEKQRARLHRMIGKTRHG